jgi:polar amino acid transport system substrate-binding protein
MGLRVVTITITSESPDNIKVHKEANDIMTRRMFRIFVLVVLLAVLSVVWGCNQGGQVAQKKESVLDKVKREKVLKVGYVKYPPYVIHDPKTGKLSGLYIDLIEQVANQMNAKIEYHETNWGNMIVDINAQKYDIQAAPIFRTIPRAMEVAFTRPIDYFGNGAVVKKGDKRFTKPADFNREGLKIAVVQGEVGHEFAKKFLPKAQMIVLKTDDISRPLLEVATGRADAGITDAWTTYQFVKAHPNVEDPFAGNPFNVVSASWFIRQGDPDWLQFLDTCIDFLESSGEIDRLSQEYQVPSFREKKAWTSGLLKKQ